ncbi:hypothetical protein D9M69_605660 [compost metagenome]
MMIWLRATPLRVISSRTFLSMARRMVSYTSRWASLSSTQWMISVFGGNSVATCSLVRRSRKGLIRPLRCWSLTSLVRFSIGTR